MTLFMLIIIALTGWIYLYQNFKKSNVLTLFVIAYLLYYDILTIIYIYKNNKEIDDLISFILLFYIFFSTFIVVLLCQTIFKKSYISNISFKIIIEKANLFSDKLIIIIFIIVSSIIAYYFYKYNLIFRISPNLKKTDTLNTYGIVISSFVLPLYTMVLIIVTSKLTSNYKKYKLLYLFLLLSIMIYFLLYGRREFILGILLMAFISSYQKNSNLFSIKKIPVLLLVFFIIIIASNLYQNIRIQVSQYAITSKLVLKKSILEYAFDFESSNKNIEDRTSIYDYTYLISKKLFQEDKEPLNGEILIQSFINVLPSIIYPNKIVINDDKLINNGLKLANSDMPNSVATSLLVDFRYLAFFIYPIFLIVYMFISMFLINKFRNNTTLYLLLISIFIYSIFNIEATITNSFVNLRNMLIIIIIILITEKIKIFLIKDNK